VKKKKGKWRVVVPKAFLLFSHKLHAVIRELNEDFNSHLHRCEQFRWGEKKPDFLLFSGSSCSGGYSREKQLLGLSGYCHNFNPRSCYWKDWDIVMKVVREDEHTAMYLRFADFELRRDPNIVMVAVQQNGLALKYANDELHRDRHIVMVAVQQNGLALEYANDELKMDLEIAAAALMQNYDAKKYVSEALTSNGDFIDLMGSFNYIKSEVARGIIRGGIEESQFWKCTFAGERQKKYEELLKNLVRRNVKALEYAPRWFKEDRRQMLSLVRMDGRALEHVIPDLCEYTEEYEELVLAAARQNPLALQYAKLNEQQGSDIAAKLQEVAEKHAQIQEWNPTLTSEEGKKKFNAHRKDPVFMRHVMYVDGLALQYATKTLKNNFDIVAAAVRQNRDALQYANKSDQHSRSWHQEAELSDYEDFSESYDSEND